jgi:hypothetical protein
MSDSSKMALHVIYEDGTEVDVNAGQREMAAWEMAGHGSSVDGAADKPMAFFRYLAWAALKRLGQLPENKVKGAAMPYDVWSQLVDEVWPDDEDEASADLGPTTPEGPQEA